MTDKIYTVRFKQGEINTQHLTGASAEVYGDQLVFLNPSGELVALFQLEIVESWTVTSRSNCTPAGVSELVQYGGSAVYLPPEVKSAGRPTTTSRISA